MKLKVLLWNVQDLFVFMDKYQGEDLKTLSEAKWQLLTTSLKKNKELHKLHGLAGAINTQQPDIILLVEVGGLESVQNFNQYFLKNEYKPIHFNSNSDRGIDLAVLCKKNLTKNIRTKFHKHKVFARGVLQFEYRPTENERFIFLLTHLKSKLNKAGDFEGRTQREKEVKKLIEIFDKVSENNQFPTFICGDLNGIIYQNETEPELDLFATKSGLFDVFEHLDRSHFERATYVYYNDQGNAHLMQLDYCLFHKKWLSLINKSSRVIDFDGQTRTSLVSNLTQKRDSPSDHYPVLINLDLR